MTEQNVAIVKRWFEEVWNQRNADVIDELLTDESVCHDGDRELRGPAEFKVQQFEPFLAAFSDLRVELDDVTAKNDQVIVRWTATGTHDGPGLGFPATNEPVRLKGMTWIVIQDGKLREGWQQSNMVEVIGRLQANVAD